MSTSIFTTLEREKIREALITAARADPRVTGAALTGSAALGREDRWSDIDLALCVAEDADMQGIVTEWTARMYEEHGAVHHLDVMRGTTLFRVFLLIDTLQVDLAFWEASAFGATAPTFRLLFGRANERPHTPLPDPAALIGAAWLYARACSSSLARGRVWQAEYMLSHMREQVLALACLRCGVPAVQGRGLDELPPELTEPFKQALPRSLDLFELKRAFRVTCDALLVEIEQVDGDLFARLTGPLEKLVG